MVETFQRENNRAASDLDFHQLVDVEAGWIDRRIFWNADIYQLELERIFARCWCFVGHESQFTEPGDFLTTHIGQDAVIVAKDRKGEVNVFLNSCTHRGNRVCFAEAGTARQFTCNFHGWAFGLDGGLVSIHEEEHYSACANFDKSKLGLHRARTQSYKGLIFATFDPEAPSLDEYLGDYRYYLDVLLDNDPGGTEFLEGNVKSRLRSNWKFAAENFVGDAYHAGWTHASAAEAIFGRGVKVNPEKSFQASVNGHGTEFGLDLIGNAMALGEPEVVDYLKENEARFAERLGKLRAKMVGAMSSANVFPNLAYLPGLNTWRTWLPKGAHEIELNTWVLVNRDAPKSLKEAYRRGISRTFSPTGMFESDDGENWEHCTHSNAGVVTRRQKLHYGLGLDSAIDHEEFPGKIHRVQLNDANQRAFYKRWADLMSASDWSSLDNN
ncbi:Rieske 2Fe-2S domain-containing protein [Altererythrobacter marinus]|uniref:Rieske 2Fe-2S domain-containing protein n=1 Tax=Pelagerythrobacter marinus TaxID=538382 RepID=A0ABW9V2H4_9SPHN|nr:SRPBCC family protein [Pelagerythrobacter marinus]MXO69992.1 Rieske 2Fe-2S domain-containing protein [Pelagerythrobacter marinus]